MNSSICKNCKHWEKDHRAWRANQGQCNSDKLVSNGHPGLDELDGSAWEASENTTFTTGPNFGCVHFEQKE